MYFPGHNVHVAQAPVSHSMLGACELSFGGFDGDGTAGNRHWLKAIKEREKE